MEETDVVAVLGCRSSEESVMKMISMKRATLLVAIVKGRSAYTKRMYGEVVKSGQYSKPDCLVLTSSMKTISMKMTELLLVIVIRGTGYKMKVYCEVLESGQ